MTSRYDHYLKDYAWGGDWDMPAFMKALHEHAEKIEKGLSE